MFKREVNRPWYYNSRSEKKDKRIWHKRFRTRVRLSLHHEKETMPHIRECSNVWDMNKDGRKDFENNQARKKYKIKHTHRRWKKQNK